MTTKEGPRATPGSLRGRIMAIGAGMVLLTVFGLGGLVALTVRLQNRLLEVSETLLEEQGIGDRITQAVMRQLALASTYTTQDDASLREDFRLAGEEAFGQIQLYLFRTLSEEERIQLEVAKDQLQRLEVAAAAATELRQRGEMDASRAQLTEMTSHAFTLLDALGEFLRMRQVGFEQLRVQQSATFRVIYIGVGALALLVLAGVIFITAYVHRRLVRPLGGLASATERLGMGDLDVRVGGGHAEEFDVVATGFNRMAASLQHMRESLEQRNDQLLDALEQVRAAQAELIQSEKLSAIGRMTAGLAHELNNPLAGVLGYGELLRAWLEKGGDVPSERVASEFLAPILQEASRAQHLVRNFLRFARESDTELGPVDLGEAVSVVAELRRFAFQQEGLDIRVGEFPERHVMAERQQLQGILLNLVNNAYDAMKGRGAGILRIYAKDVEDGVEISFEDEGPGMDAPDQVFEPFYTTKPVGEGTGLGLSVVYRRMEEFGGSVRAENLPDVGARFVLTFRASQRKAEPPGVGEPPEPLVLATPEGRRPKILVVEDEAPLRKLQERLLAQIDAEVLLAAGVEEAKALLVEHEVDAIVSDVRMPGETGLDLYEWVARERPDLVKHFLFVTGDVGAPEVLTLADRRPEIFVHKPFELREYLTRVAAVLE